MQYPYAAPIPAMKDMTTVFRGLNKTLSAGDGEFADMQNMTADFFPVLSPRPKRLKCHEFTKCNGIYGKDNLLWVDGTDLYYNGELAADNELADNKKTFVGMGAYVLIFPDKKVFNTADGTLSNIQATFETAGDVDFKLCDAEGNDYEYTASTDAPASPTAGQYWLDKSGENPSLKRYSAATSEWVAITTTYVKVQSTGVGANFHQYDGVSISGCSNSQFNTDHILGPVSDDYIVLTGQISENFTQEWAEDSFITVSRACPDMDFLTECNNRVWGCAATGREIYACRQGDPFNWRAYEAISTASYAVTVGTDGSFTGAATHGGYPVFFKEQTIHKILGTIASNFALSTTEAPGVQYGCSASICLVNGKLLYKAVKGVVAYDGGYPVKISDALGNSLYGAAVGGRVDDKYYVCMRDAANAYHLFVYDTRTGLWHREDGTQVVFFAHCQSDTFFVKSNELWAITRGDKATAFDEVEEGGTDPLAWYAETCDQFSMLPNAKYVNKFQISAELPEGSTLTVSMQYDSDGVWHEVYSSVGAAVKRGNDIPIVPQYCHFYRMKIAGTGDAKVFYVHRTLTEGSGS